MKYDQSTIYKLCCNDLSITDIYIGSTTNFNRRKSQHKSLCNNEKTALHNLYVYQFIRDHGGFQNWSMVEMELFNARDKKNLHRRERHWIETQKASLNSRKSYITEEEIKEYKAEYRANNADEIKEYQAEYRANNADEIKEYRANNVDKIKETQSEYRAKNVDKIKERNAEYRVKNADKIKEKHAEKVTCSCGSIISKGGISRHINSKKHQTFLEQLPSIS
jgi:hypothetical protein